MTENQKLREVLQRLLTRYTGLVNSGDAGNWDPEAEREVIAARQALALPPTDELNLSDPAVQKRLAAQWGYVLPTAAPEMPLSMNQFGRLVELTREHLTDNTFVYKATSKAGDTCHFGVESAAKAWAKGGTVEAIKVREFKLHTSSPNAAPVGEREAFEAWLGITPCGAAHDFGWAAWQARAALSAGDAVDAVDAQRYRLVRRGQHFSVINGIGDTLRGEALDAAADAAMRKDKP